MAGEKDRVLDAQGAQKEAKADAAHIQAASSPEEAYTRFKEEINAMEVEVSDESLRKEYRKNLKKAVGIDLDKILVEYLSDDENAKLKNKNGVVTDRTIVANLGDDATDLDRALLPEVAIQFEILMTASHDGFRGGVNPEGITAKDLEVTKENQKAADELAKANLKVADEKAASIAANKKEGFADALLDPNRSHLFQEIAAANNTFSSDGAEISKEDLREFLEEQYPAYTEADKDYRYPPSVIQKLQQIYDNWDSPQANEMKTDDNLTKDSIAKGCGFDGYAQFLDEFANKNKEVDPTAAGNEEIIEKPTVASEPETTAEANQSDLKSEKLAESATQKSGQGYWQVAESMLEATAGEEDKPENRAAENIILMRALQMQRKQHGGPLGKHQFVASQSDLPKLNENIDTYVEENPRFAKYAEALKARFKHASVAS